MSTSYYTMTNYLAQTISLYTESYLFGTKSWFRIDNLVNFPIKSLVGFDFTNLNMNNIALRINRINRINLQEK